MQSMNFLLWSVLVIGFVSGFLYIQHLQVKLHRLERKVKLQLELIDDLYEQLQIQPNPRTRTTAFIGSITNR